MSGFRVHRCASLLLLLLLPPPLIEGGPVGVVGGPVSLGGPSAPQRVRYSHAGLCPNEVNPNLWVDAQSTCDKECVADHVCENHEKCCPNVCGSRSCVASRFVASNPSTSSSSSSQAADERRSPFGRSRGSPATCARVICAQQGSQCDLWDGQPICRCRDRCEPEPNFTCASDGLTYYNRCYMDAEACNKGVALAVVPCRFQLPWPAPSSESSTQVSNLSLGGSEATLANSPIPATSAAPQATGAAHSEGPRAAHDEVVAPVLLANPVHQVIRAGGTVSFVCGIATRSKAEVTWEKQVQHPHSRHATGSTASAMAAGPRGATAGTTGAGGDVSAGLSVTVMRPDHVYGNAVVTNIGQLVIYNARQEDSGSYTCLLSNRAGAVRASFTLSVVPFPPATSSASAAGPGGHNRHRHNHHQPDVCQQPADRHAGCGGSQHVWWHYDARRNGCHTFARADCRGSASTGPSVAHDRRPSSPTLPSSGDDHAAAGASSRGNAFETHDECRAACVNETARACALPPVQGPCRAWETRWGYNPLGKRCAAFAYGGCDGNGNNFASRAACERACPVASAPAAGGGVGAGVGAASVCRPCRTRNKIVPSFCRSDFAIVGRTLEVVDDGTDAGLVRFTVDEVLKDDKMGLKAFDIKLLEITMLQVDWGCPCPNITAADGGPLLVMGEVQEGIAVLYPDSYVRAVSERRARKLYEVVDRKTCDLLQRFHD